MLTDRRPRITCVHLGDTSVEAAVSSFRCQSYGNRSLIVLSTRRLNFEGVTSFSVPDWSGGIRGAAIDMADGELVCWFGPCSPDRLTAQYNALRADGRASGAVYASLTDREADFRTRWLLTAMFWKKSPEGRVVVADFPHCDYYQVGAE